jgi:hypothetical protein
MIITIVTVFDSHNFGSYLQAKCLRDALARYGEVIFYDGETRNNRKIFSVK